MYLGNINDFKDEGSLCVFSSLWFVVSSKRSYWLNFLRAKSTASLWILFILERKLEMHYLVQELQYCGVKEILTSATHFYSM